MTDASQRASAPVKVNAPRTRAPLTGIVAGLALVGGLGLWTFQRIGEAKSLQSDVETRRAADGERSARLASEPQRVHVVRGRSESWQPRIDLDGTLEAQHQAELGFQVSGRLARVNVKVGDRVRAGATLAQLDVLEAAAQATAAEAQVRAAEASLALARDGERRTLPLVQSGSFAEASGVQASGQRELAHAQLDSARAQLALAQAGVVNRTLGAPFSGTITRAPTGIGLVVSPGQALFELVDTSTLKLATTVSEDDANLLRTGAEIRIAGSSGEVSGRVTAILASLDARTRRVPVVAELDNTARGAAGPPLRAGAFVRAWASARDEIPVLRLPHTVLRPGSRDEVLVVDAATLRLDARRIGYAISADGSLLVRRGIGADDDVVLTPTPEAKPGDLVHIEPDATAEPGVTVEPARARPAPPKAAAP